MNPFTMNPFNANPFNVNPVIGGMRVVESSYAVTKERVKTHKRRRGQSLRYHLRVDKKWKKRYGFCNVPACLITNGTVIMHPEFAAELRRTKGA